MASRRRARAAVVLALISTLITGTAWAADADVAAGSGTDAVVIRGSGTAHGLGMAMDGVQAQARAGWTHDRILSLFYAGTTTGRASGTIKVGLAHEPVVTLTLPSGGTVSNAPMGATPGTGFPVAVAPGATVTVRRGPGGLSFTPAAAQRPASPKPSPRPTPGANIISAGAGPEVVPPTPPPVGDPTPTPRPERPNPTPPPGEPSPGGGTATSPASERLWVWGAGDPALVRVAATGRRYRGSIEVVPREGALTVINHVDLETYVAGIAEEKGAGWPLEGLKVLAIAARTLGAATMSWYDKNRSNGYHICPTDQCQVYLGYDGEEPMMRRATAETAGQIRTYNGRPILAMYHGNGGGQTETYKRLIDYPGDPHPYLRSVRYPFASPKHWTRNETFASIESYLRGAGVAVPGRLTGLEVLERGDSPRVVRLRIRGEDGELTITGQRFMDALDLWSTWFHFDTQERHPPAAAGLVLHDEIGYPIATQDTAASDARSTRPWLAWIVGMLALVALGSAGYLVVSRELPLDGPAWGVPVRGALLYGSDAAS